MWASLLGVMRLMSFALYLGYPPGLRDQANRDAIVGHNGCICWGNSFKCSSGTRGPMSYARAKLHKRSALRLFYLFSLKPSGGD
ncbi:hypothetical protein EV127DRAFT_191843 [Xylaria flabelliformis]|nr:hypothetical protein EV127DRAFT_191843 [Xylaria flabelliformis]